jgi:hypothetical protein
MKKLICNFNYSQHQHDFEIEHKKFVLSFSLWNSDPNHLNGAIRNIELAKVIYHAWQIRFYVV